MKTPQSWHVNRNLSHLPKVATSYSSIFMPHQTPSLAMRFGTTTACFMLYSTMQMMAMTRPGAAGLQLGQARWLDGRSFVVKLSTGSTPVVPEES